VRIGGTLQDKKTFPRFTGYVEQFDVQSAELTVYETVLFSSQLRLDQSHPAAKNSDMRKVFVEKVIGILELSSLSNRIVGSLEENDGLTFEQRKRLSIAVELAASPSILFLDEVSYDLMCVAHSYETLPLTSLSCSLCNLSQY
jgi:ABC-type multidrug transport system ATPase subunit